MKAPDKGLFVYKPSSNTTARPVPCASLTPQAPHRMRLSPIFTFLATSLALAPQAYAGPIAYGICQTGCNVLAVACYAAAGFTFGTVAAPAAPAAIVACNSGLGTCSAACASVALLAPTP
ncbi:hypothetical protein EDD18DRAFT_200744 [Armillaria luteobubalina]|uniref:Cysteine-rich protein n=1 Tax=Armillaria luteobubalina TaxID=153913 RepID=A0AA39UWV2_9AGAR|nr:hypothetical protein EDD18DRAFT_200744 [Armillaria luteobubalina]